MKQTHASPYIRVLSDRLIVSVICMLSLIAVLTGCGKKENDTVTAYQSDIDSFTSAILELDTKINNINPSSDDAVSELLSYYDSMEEEFLKLANMTVPEEYSDIVRLSEKASEYMSKAVAYYHTALESETLDRDILNVGTAYYTKAFEFVNYIGQVMMGADITFESDLETETDE